MSSTYDVIRAAIEFKLQVRATYNGRARRFCPHVLGHTKGKALALCYQFAGESEKGLSEAGSIDNWRCIPIEGLMDVVAIAGPWHTAANYTGPETQRCVEQVEVAVQL